MSNSANEWMAIGAKLKSAREYLGLSQDEAAAAIGISRSAISLAESGKRKIDALELSKFSELYSQSVESLTGRALSTVQDGNVDALARAASTLSEEDRDQLLNFAMFLQNRKPDRADNG